MAKAASKPSAVIDTRVIYCGDNLEQLRKLSVFKKAGTSSATFMVWGPDPIPKRKNQSSVRRREVVLEREEIIES